MNLPRILIISTSSVDHAENIATELGSERIADSDNLHYYSWTIDNKYYSVRVLLFVTDALTLDTSLDDVEAIIIHHDSKAENPTRTLDDYLPLVNSLSNADIFLLACQSFDNSETKDKVSEWSRTHNFEMVELERANTFDITDEEIENNVCGMDRIIEALHTHLWPNRILKGNLTNSSIESSPDINNVEDQLGSMRLNSGAQRNSEQSLMESMLDGMMGEENADFGELFGRLMDMKEHAASLSTNNRRAAAEQLVTVFWKAMGGDPSEVENLDD
ncbi:alpha- and gamma-adaptin-binding protein p34-like [Venturia canescens]|uniref:alpha- and gamma-adaptin-binding protein p34-like n=1 Tax=Venturia canescens TaxID=32260 RepID=UPI001C9D599D|nr:alpha- and gamma-adaptin-binding protein p34-like [Venturia canescens]